MGFVLVVRAIASFKFHSVIAKRYDEPESRNGACLRYVMIRNRQMRVRVSDF